MLFGTSNAHIGTRKILIDKCKLEGVISMPSEVFKPYAGVSTEVLVFQKGGTTDNVWFYDMEADGFSLDDKRQKIVDNDIPDIVKQWNARVALASGASVRKAAEPKVEYAAKNGRSGKCFLVPVAALRANTYDLSISRYKEIEHKEIEYEKPEAIIKKVLELEREIAKEIDEIGKLT